MTIAALAIVSVAVLGPLGLLAAGGVTVAGGAVAMRARARLKNPSRAGGRSGLLATLAGRPRRTRSVRTWTKGIGSLPWPLTGSQSRRGRSRAAGGSGTAGGSRRRGAGAALRGLAPKLPALTSKGRERRRTAHLATGSHGRGTNRATAPRAAVRPGAKPTGARAPRTPSRTPARAGSARKLTTAPARTRQPGGAKPGATLRAATRRSPGSGASGTLRNANRRGNGTQSRRTGRTALPKLGGGTGTTRTRKASGVRPSTAARPVRRHNRTAGTKSTTGRGGLPRLPKTPTRPTTRSGGGSRNAGTPPTVRVRRNRPAASSRTRDRATGGSPRTTTNAKRLGDMTRPTTRRNHRAAAKATPTRTRRHPLPPVKKQPTRKLVSSALRLPRRNGWKISRPSKRQASRARKVLSRGARRAARRGAVWSLKAPFKATAATARWSWLHRPLAIYPKAPAGINPEWLVPTVPEPRLSTSPGQKKFEEKTKTRRHRTPYPTVNARRSPAGGTRPGTPAAPRTTQPATGGTITMSAPAQSVAEAFQSIASFTPQTPEELETFLAQAAEMVQQIGSSFQTLGQRMTSEMPLAQPVAAGMTELGVALGACHGIAGQVHSTYVAAHEVEKQRRENPRPNEGFWDVGNR